MPSHPPDRVLITGGREIGGVRSFADSLAEGFSALGIPSRIISPGRIISELSELRDPRVLKILSTGAVYAAPLARRAICIAHGVPGAAYNGWARMALIIGSYKLAHACSGTQLVAVSQYTASQLEVFFGSPVDEIVLNAVKSVYLDGSIDTLAERNYITYLGRLTTAKGIARLLPVIRDILDEQPGLRMCIVGEGPEKASMMASVSGDPRFEFAGNISDEAARDQLRRTRLFISGHKAEGFGITYLEALSQGCAVAMPAGGGGVEIALDRVGTQVHLFPLSFDRQQTLAALRNAVRSDCTPLPMKGYSAQDVAQAYLNVDARFSQSGYIDRSPKALK